MPQRGEETRRFVLPLQEGKSIGLELDFSVEVRRGISVPLMNPVTPFVKYLSGKPGASDPWKTNRKNSTAVGGHSAGCSAHMAECILPRLHFPRHTYRSAIVPVVVKSPTIQHYCCRRTMHVCRYVDRREKTSRGRHVPLLGPSALENGAPGGRDWALAAAT